jgi:hypothetical protein
MNIHEIRSTGGKDDASAHFEAQRLEFVRDLKDLDACIQLWRTVIERAVMDLQYLQRHAGRENLKKHELEKLRRIQENPPTDFLEGPWFEQICDYLQVDPDRVRSGLDSVVQHAA